jgi:hypothetical protein
MIDSFGDGWQGASWTLKEAGGEVVVAGPYTFSSGASATEVFTAWTAPPTAAPTAVPTNVGDTYVPTPSPTDAPTSSPTTAAPTESPTPAPTASPTQVPVVCTWIHDWNWVSDNGWEGPTQDQIDTTYNGCTEITNGVLLAYCPSSLTNVDVLSTVTTISGKSIMLSDIVGDNSMEIGYCDGPRATA